MKRTQFSLSKAVKRAVKHTVQHVGRLAPASLYINRPLRRWPRVLGVIHEIAVPRGVRRNTMPQPRSGAANINIILELMDKTANVPGDIGECGVFRGRTLLAMAIYVRERGTGRQIIGFDSFAGFDDSVNIDINLGGPDTDEYRKVGGFSDTSPDLILAKVRRLSLTNVVLVEGFFSNTLSKYGNGQFSFVHLDCDTYCSYKECLEFFYPRVAPGGIILFDEYNDPPWPGCNQAVDEFLRNKPEKPVRIVADNYEKYYIVKQSNEVYVLK
jgi:O-methyltransferase